MPLKLMRNDITKVSCDAIVNAAKPSLLGGGGVDGAIHAAAGPKLLQACRKLGGCATGKAVITKGYDLPAKYVIHTVGPVWQGGDAGEPALLRSCYLESLLLAQQHRCKTVAFPLISAGAYGYPADQALSVATDAIRDFLEDHEMTVYLVVYDRKSFQLGKALYEDLEALIDETYVADHPYNLRPREDQIYHSSESQALYSETPDAGFHAPPPPTASYSASMPTAPAHHKAAGKQKPLSLEDMLSELDESFSQMLLRKIDEKGLTDAQCYKRANIDRKLFSKIRKDVHYRPSKPTAIAFAIALELDLRETAELLRKAGFALSHSSKFDIIIEYFIRRGNYDIFQINEALFAFDQSLLGV